MQYVAGSQLKAKVMEQSGKRTSKQAEPAAVHEVGSDRSDRGLLNGNGSLNRPLLARCRP